MPITQDEIKTLTAEEAIDFFKLNHTADPIQCLRIVEQSIQNPAGYLYPGKVCLASPMRKLCQNMKENEYEKLCILVMSEIWKSIWEKRHQNMGIDIHEENRPKI